MEEKVLALSEGDVVAAKDFFTAVKAVVERSSKFDVSSSKYQVRFEASELGRFTLAARVSVSSMLTLFTPLTTSASDDKAITAESVGTILTVTEVEAVRVKVSSEMEMVSVVYTTSSNDDREDTAVISTASAEPEVMLTPLVAAMVNK